MNELKRALSSVTYQLYANALLRSGLLAASAYLVAATFAGPSVLAILIASGGFLAGVFRTRLYQDKTPQAVRLIHQTVGDAEYSLPLLDKAELNLAEQLQLERLNERVRKVRVSGVVWASLGGYLAGLLAAFAVYLSYPLLNRHPDDLQGQRLLPAFRSGAQPLAPAFRTATLHIQPPAYTGLAATHSTDLNASAVSGSSLTWQLRFRNPDNLSVRLVNSRGQERAFRRAGHDFFYQDRLVSSGLYTLKAYWRLAGGRDSVVYQSDFYRLEAKPDLAPKIEPASKELYRFHYLNDPKVFTTAAKISDDFRVSQAFIVATVARGSGENVKFREMKLPLSPTAFREARLTKTIDLRALQFAPGDELYYYWAAFDNRRPEPNFAKSDTYFMVYKDTTQLEASELATMAVNLMPEYFRSQRQIIIDTETLIAGRKKMTSSAFNSQSNEIGFDQKALRLRYGQFLGEEFENTIGGGNALPDDAPDGDPLAGFMHDHDKGEGEHETPSDAHDHGHPHGGGSADSKDPVAALMEQYVHQHDDAETNTFHEQSTRSLLKMALENMWQSELHLRLYEPEKALPFERKALEYLKLSQQKARSYVKKTGFDPPPIKEAELRLTGELKNVNPTFRQERTLDRQRIEPLVAQVLGYLELPRLHPQQRLAVQRLGNALADRTLNSSLANWSVLALLQKLAGGKPLSDSERAQLKTRLYALSGADRRTNATYRSEPTLERAFWRRLQ